MQKDFFNDISNKLNLPTRNIHGRKFSIKKIPHEFTSIKDIQKIQNLVILDFFSNDFFIDDVEIEKIVYKYNKQDISADEAMNLLNVYYLNLLNREND